MIIDELQCAENYLSLHPAFTRAFEFLRRSDLDQLEARVHEIDSAELYASVQRTNGRQRSEAELEAHRRYVDIQFLIDGEEEIGWRPRGECREVSHAYDEEQDITFWSDAPSFYVSLRPGMFAVFFPGDAHAPLISRGNIHKCVVKVRI